MGYCYSATTGRLACDACGCSAGTTRKRTCPHHIQYADGGSLPYCQPSALCRDCYAKHKAKLHEGCRDGAARRNAEERARGERLAAGEYEVRTAWGDWHALVPAGMVGVRFVNGTGGEAYRLVDKAHYEGGDRRLRYLSEYAIAQPWEAHP